uniref:Uncharacterized protein n=1 Tax=Moniliophthora roreri TaxID=221103 RepID=A0A0W0F9S4_MONRR
MEAASKRQRIAERFRLAAQLPILCSQLFTLLILQSTLQLLPVILVTFGVTMQLPALDIPCNLHTAFKCLGL